MGAILLVEDSAEYHKVVGRALGEHRVTCVTTVDEALVALGEKTFDLILLDIGLPQKNGYTLLAEYRSETGSALPPVICLTGRSQISDKVTAFSLGVDDYLIKPFDPLELKIRVESKLKKRQAAAEVANVLKGGGIEIDLAGHSVFVQDESSRREVVLTQTEYRLLCTLLRRPGQVFTRDQLLVAAWGADARVLDRAVDVQLCNLRQKLGSHSACIRSVTGVGYKFMASKARSAAKAA